MSARPERPATVGAGVAIVAAAVLVLAVRPFVGASPDSRIALFAVAYAAIGFASLAVPRPASATVPPLAPAAVLALGFGAVAAATVAGGSAVPVAWSAAALPLSLLAAVAEEALFRRAAYGGLERFGAPLAIAVTALLFALVHLPAYGTSAFPVDLGAGLLLGWQRWASGTWAVPAATHAAANLVAVLR